MTNDLKAQCPDDRSGPVIVSFSNKWDPLIRRGNIDVVFRKRIPTSFIPTILYFYIASPISAIIGSADIEKTSVLSPERAFELANSGQISHQELAEYIGDNIDIGVYFISSIIISPKPLKLETLKNKYRFNPPQSFVALSMYGAQCLDKDINDK